MTINKASKKKIADYLEDLIIEGINLTRNTKSDGIVLSVDDPATFLSKIHKEYFLWINNLKKFLNKTEITNKIDISFLYEGDSVPYRYGGLEYDDPRSEKYQNLIENIRKETSKKLEMLRQVKPKVIITDKQKEAIGLRKVLFIDNEAVLKIGNKKCHIPPSSHMHSLCRVVFRHTLNEPVDWSIIYEEMTGNKEGENFKKDKKSVYDTLDRINKAVKKCLNTDDELLSWDRKTIKRNY
jgi:hypothetical protein